MQLWYAIGYFWVICVGLGASIGSSVALKHAANENTRRLLRKLYKFVTITGLIMGTVMILTIPKIVEHFQAGM